MGSRYTCIYFRKGEELEQAWFERLPLKSRWLVAKIHQEMRDEPFIIEEEIRRKEQEIKDLRGRLDDARKREGQRPPAAPKWTDASTTAFTPDVAEGLLRAPGHEVARADPVTLALYWATSKADAQLERFNREKAVEVVHNYLTGPAHRDLKHEGVNLHELAETIVSAVAEVRRRRAEKVKATVERRDAHG